MRLQSTEVQVALRQRSGAAKDRGHHLLRGEAVAPRVFGTGDVKNVVAGNDHDRYNGELAIRYKKRAFLLKEKGE